MTLKLHFINYISSQNIDKSDMLGLYKIYYFDNTYLQLRKHYLLLLETVVVHSNQVLSYIDNLSTAFGTWISYCVLCAFFILPGFSLVRRGRGIICLFRRNLMDGDQMPRHLPKELLTSGALLPAIICKRVIFSGIIPAATTTVSG